MISENERAFFERAPVPLVLYQKTDGQIRAVLASDGYCRQVGNERETVLHHLNTDLYKRVHPDDVEWLTRAGEEFARKERDYDILYRTRTTQGEEYHLIHALGRWLTLLDGSEAGIIIYSDMTNATSGIEHLFSVYDNSNNLLYRDTVTGLPNLNYMRQFSDEKIKMLRLLEKQPMLLYTDVIALQSYNNQYGYAEGDALLRLVADTIRATYPDGLVVRGADDHFIVIDEFTGEDAIHDKLRVINETVRARANGNAYGIRTGVCRIDADKTATFAIDAARRALQEIGNDLNVECCIYTSALDEQEWKGRYIIDTFDAALENHWIRVYYQGIVRTSTKKITLLESLARWIDPGMGSIQPDEFIPVLSKYHQLYRLDLYMVEEICREYGVRKEAGLPLLPVTVNFSAQDFDHADIPTRLNEILERYGVGRENLIVEITEQDIARGAEHFRAQLKRLRADGYKLWIDDFGSGYSSLNVFGQYGIDRIKFDIELLRHLDDNNGANRRIMKAFVNVCRELGVHTLAEGVETEAQWAFLKEIDCEMAQGFYFYRPNPLEAAVYKIKLAKRAHNFETGEERRRECADWLSAKDKLNMLLQRSAAGVTLRR
jgi:diguanylate cyclase (GGDEF)-like protein